MPEKNYYNYPSCDITSTHLVSAAEVAGALLLTASGYWLWEVEVDALSHRAGTVVVQAGQEASFEAVQGQRVVEIYLVCTVTVYP